LSKRLIMRDFSCEKWRIVTEKEKFNSFVEPPKKNFLRSTYTSVSVLTLSKKIGRVRWKETVAVF